MMTRKLASSRCGPSSLVGLALLLALVTGVMADLPGGLFRPVDDTPFRDRPARLIPIRGFGFVTGGLSDLVALAVVFEGQTLRVESSNLRVGPPLSGTIAGFLQSEGGPQGFQLFQVRNPGRVIRVWISQVSGLLFRENSRRLALLRGYAVLDVFDRLAHGSTPDHEW